MAQQPDDPLDYIDMVDVLQHGDPTNWTLLGEKPGSGGPAKSAYASPGTKKIYEVYKDEFGSEIEVHYFRYPDGTVGNVKVAPRS